MEDPNFVCPHLFFRVVLQVKRQVKVTLLVLSLLSFVIFVSHFFCTRKRPRAATPSEGPSSSVAYAVLFLGWLLKESAGSGSPKQLIIKHRLHTPFFGVCSF